MVVVNTMKALVLKLASDKWEREKHLPFLTATTTRSNFQVSNPPTLIRLDNVRYRLEDIFPGAL